MIDEYDDYDDYDYEKKSAREKLKIFAFGSVITALVVAVGTTLISNYMNRNTSYGRIVAVGELYDAPTYEAGFSAISYETLHPEQATEAEPEVSPTEDPEMINANSGEVIRDKALDNIKKIDRNYVNDLLEQRQKYKLHTVTPDNELTTEDPNVVTPVNLAEGNVDYYAGTIATPIYLNPEEVGAEYLGNWKITAYCACVQCCEKSDGITASGAMVQANHTIAAPKEFKFGTKLLVGGQLYTVEDRGGGIHGNRIDIYFNSHQEACDFGVRYMDVYLVP